MGLPNVETELFNLGNHTVLKVMPKAVAGALVSGRGLLTLAAVAVGALCMFFAVWSGADGPESAGPLKDPPAALLREVAAALTWGADTDDEKNDDDDGGGAESGGDDATAFARAVSAAAPSWPAAAGGGADASVAAWATARLDGLQKEAGGGLAAAAFAALAGAPDAPLAWEAHETVRGAAAGGAEEADPDRRAAAVVLVETVDLHASLVIVGARCRPAMPSDDERGVLVVVAGAFAAARTGRATRLLRSRACAPFVQSASRCLRAAGGGPALAVLLRAPRA